MFNLVSSQYGFWANVYYFISVGVFSLIVTFILLQLDNYNPLFDALPLWAWWALITVVLLLLNVVGVPVRDFLIWVYSSLADSMNSSSDVIYCSIYWIAGMSIPAFCISKSLKRCIE